MMLLYNTVIALSDLNDFSFFQAKVINQLGSHEEIGLLVERKIGLDTSTTC